MVLSANVYVNFICRVSDTCHLPSAVHQIHWDLMIRRLTLAHHTNRGKCVRIMINVIACLSIVMPMHTHTLPIESDLFERHH